MRKIGLVVGETSSLPKEIIQEQKFAFVPYVVDWRDGENIPGENIFQKMREAEKRGIKTLPKTSQPSPWTFKKVFKEELKKSEYILCITLSSKLSGGYNSAILARGMLSNSEKEKVFVLDSLNVTAGEGLFDIRAAELIKSKKNIKEVFKELKEFIPKVHLIGFLEDPKWLEAGGRLSHPLAVLIRQMQKIGMRPLIGVKDGLVKAVSLRMRAKDIPSALFKELKRQIKNKKVQVAITHADNLEGAEKLKELINKELKEVEIAFVNLIDTVVGVHVGPGTLTLAWTEIS